MATLETLVFDNVALRALPVDNSLEQTPRIVNGACFSRVKPIAVDNPRSVAYSLPALLLLDLSETEANKPQFVEYFSGNKLLPGSNTAAHCYCGYQFGTFAGQLGDGAAMYLGEVINSRGERWEVQLKGAGLTPYSRRADGRKVLRSSIREFLCSEAMHHLGIPTTRAAACIVSDSTVTRDIFCDENPVIERCSIVTRIAPTFIRFGSFEIFNGVDEKTGRQGPSCGRRDILEQLTTYVISSFYPQIWMEHSRCLQSAVPAFCKQVVMATARLVAHWQCVGFCHGGPNTDNTSIVGITLDYGPFGFQDKFQRDFVSNTSDYGGRYSYSQQPAMLRWNCVKLAEALQPLVDDTCDLQDLVHVFDEEFTSTYYAIMSRKLGFIGRAQCSDRLLVDAFLDVLEATGADFTNSFRSLSRVPLPGDKDYERRRQLWLDYFLSQSATPAEMEDIHRSRTDPRKVEMIDMLLKKDEDFANRLGLNSDVLERERSRQLMLRSQPTRVLTHSDKRSTDLRIAFDWLHSYSQRLLADLDIERSDRVRVMNNTNPRYILRTYMAQTAIAGGG